MTITLLKGATSLGGSGRVITTARVGAGGWIADGAQDARSGIPIRSPRNRSLVRRSPERPCAPAWRRTRFKTTCHSKPMWASGARAAKSAPASRYGCQLATLVGRHHAVHVNDMSFGL
jgi:hypothetical protein